MDSQSTSIASTKPDVRKPYLRVLTDKRREQNRRAQKAYRERLKKKLEVLEQQAGFGSSAPPNSNAQANTGHDTKASANADSIESKEQSEELPSSRIDLGDDVDENLSLSIEEAPITTTSRPDSRIINLADAFVAAGDLPMGGSTLPNVAFQIAPTPEPKLDVEEVEHTHEDYGEIDLHQIWAMPSEGHPYQMRYPTPPGSLFGSTSLMTLTPQDTTISHHSSIPRSKVADPYLNHMQLIGEENIEASLAVALALKITRSQYINDHPSHFPGCYVALNKSDLRSRTVTYRFADAFMDITPQLADHLDLVKQPLRPTPAQLLNPHPTYLDCIVFPYFRDHAVKASAEGILDHMNLFMDMMQGGLVCWGGTSGLSNRHGRSTKSGKRDTRDGVAWSTRSWEAKKWFLKKWTWLIGTEEEEEARGDVDGIWRGSRWWWAMRDEDDSNDEDGEEESLFAGERASNVETSGQCS